MIPFVLGLAAVALLLWSAGAFARASVTTVKALAGWVLAIAGLCLMAALLLSGRFVLAAGALAMLGPLVWDKWRGATGQAPGRADAPRMSRAEAYAVLGLRDGASDADIQAAWVRVMRGVHPDGGGTDWLAARVNAARDMLLRR